MGKIDVRHGLLLLTCNYRSSKHLSWPYTTCSEIAFLVCVVLLSTGGLWAWGNGEKYARQ